MRNQSIITENNYTYVCLFSFTLLNNNKIPQKFTKIPNNKRSPNLELYKTNKTKIIVLYIAVISLKLKIWNCAFYNYKHNQKHLPHWYGGFQGGKKALLALSLLFWAHPTLFSVTSTLGLGHKPLQHSVHVKIARPSLLV